MEAVTVSDMKNYVFDTYDFNRKWADLDGYNSHKIDVIDCLRTAGVDLNATGPDGLTLLQRMAGLPVFYKTICWLVCQDITVGKLDEISLSGDLLKPSTSRQLPRHKQILTDVLLMAGVQIREFVAIHLERAITCNNADEYDALMHADPFAIYTLNKDALLQYFEKLEIYEKREKKNHKQGELEDIINLRRDSQLERLSVFNRAMTDQLATPTLKQLVVSSVFNRAMSDLLATPTLKQLVVSQIRKHLIRCGHTTSLYVVIQKIPIPKPLINQLTLQAFVDFETKL